MPKILCIESSGPVCSVALFEGLKELAIREEQDAYSHAEKLAPFVQEVLNGQIPDAIALSKGPGSYTGLRIGTSLAKGLAYGFEIPLIAISTLEAMAENFISEKSEEAEYFPMIDARRMEVYTAGYSLSKKEFHPIEAKIIDENSFESNTKKWLFGDGADKLIELFKDRKDIHIQTHYFPSARFLASPALRKFESQNFEDLAYFEPFYLKEFVALKPKKKL